METRRRHAYPQRRRRPPIWSASACDAPDVSRECGGGSASSFPRATWSSEGRVPRRHAATPCPWHHDKSADLPRVPQGVLQTQSASDALQQEVLRPAVLARAVHAAAKGQSEADSLQQERLVIRSERQPARPLEALPVRQAQTPVGVEQIQRRLAMGVVYRQKGRSTWMLKYYRDGRPIYESSGTDVKDDARDTLKKREAAIVDGLPV